MNKGKQTNLAIAIKDQMISVRIPKDLYNLMVDDIERHRQDISEYIRDCIKDRIWHQEAFIKRQLGNAKRTVAILEVELEDLKKKREQRESEILKYEE